MHTFHGFELRGVLYRCVRIVGRCRLARDVHADVGEDEGDPAVVAHHRGVFAAAVGAGGKGRSELSGVAVRVAVPEPLDAVPPVGVVVALTARKSMPVPCIVSSTKRRHMRGGLVVEIVK